MAKGVPDLGAIVPPSSLLTEPAVPLPLILAPSATRNFAVQSPLPTSKMPEVFQAVPLPVTRRAHRPQRHGFYHRLEWPGAGRSKLDRADLRGRKQMVAPVMEAGVPLQRPRKFV